MRTFYKQYIVPTLNGLSFLLLTLLLLFLFLFTLAAENSTTAEFNWLLSSMSAGFLAIVLSLLAYRFLKITSPFQTFAIRAVLFSILFGGILGWIAPTLWSAFLGSLTGVTATYLRPQIVRFLQRHNLDEPMNRIFNTALKFLLVVLFFGYFALEFSYFFSVPVAILLSGGITVAGWLGFRALDKYPAIAGIFIGIYTSIELESAAFAMFQRFANGRYEAFSYGLFLLFFTSLNILLGFLIFLLIDYYGLRKKYKKLTAS